MKKLSKYYYLLAISCVMAAISSCSDERLWTGDDIIGEGEAHISAEVLFKNFTPALNGKTSRETGGTMGDALDGIDNLYLFVYSEDGKTLVYNTSFTKDSDLTVTDSNQSVPDDGEYEPNGSAALPTDRATFDCSLPYGKYRIYAVANVKSEEAKARLTADKVQTIEDLKAVKMTWDATDIEKNGQMFGSFTTEPLSKTPSRTFDAPVVVINNSSVSLHAWLRRLASKVTIAYDASKLKENVRIYIHSVTIKDIPASCYLGQNNTPDGTNGIALVDGQTIDYRDGKEKADMSGLVLSTGKEEGSDHKHDSRSLFFYENMQGDYSKDSNKDWYNKTQPADKVGTSINDPLPDPDHPSGKNDFKDRVPYGTYIEVEGYYKSDNREMMSEGKIIYRFMLGKDVTYDYDAERNYHYKLTLQFNNWANDADWHIVYEEPTPSVYTPNIYYISYIYNQDLMFPVRVVTGDDDVKKYRLKAEIIENNWAPYNGDATFEANGGVPAASLGATTDLNGFAWNRAVYENSPVSPGGGYYGKGHNYVGFLSLKETQNTVLLPDETKYNKPEVPKYLEDYYEGREGVSARYLAEYNLSSEGSFDIDNSEANGQYKVEYHTDKSVTVQVPMYTRAKQMVPPTDFTGNNPFDSYMRMARVKFTLLNEKGEQVGFKNVDNPNGPLIKERIVPIYQVRRIVNPKAIWRKSGSTEEFNVELTHRPDAASTVFETFKSVGPWRAYILKDPDGVVTLTDGATTVKTAVEMNGGVPSGDMIMGNTDTEIKFKYTPTGANGCAIIRVDYHDYTCHHLIFVRTGYDYGVKLGNAHWSCYNVYATNAAGNPATNIANVNVEVTENPLSVGSFFKRNNYNYAILEKNNATYGWLKPVGTTKETVENNRTYIDINYTNVLETAYLDNSNSINKRTVKWDDFGGHAWTMYSSGTERFSASWATTWNATNRQAKLAVPTYEDYMSLVNSDNIEFGYGVVYGDGVKNVAKDLDDAYRFIDYDNNGEDDTKNSKGETKGIRACVVYDSSNGNQIIFPMGSVGQARRARSVYDFENPRNRSLIGSLIYSGVKGVLTGDGNTMRPMTYNLYRMPGAVYWIKQPAKRSDNTDCASWDINYNNFVFNHYDGGSLGSRSQNNNGTWNNINNATSSDALPIRLIYK